MSMNPKYPIYIVSKGRWKNPKTVRALEEIGVTYKIVIEPQEYENYVNAIGKDNILVLPFSDLGQGSIPARNWVWTHSMLTGNMKHWVLDDNISGFCRYNHNLRVKVNSGTIFRCAEDFVDRYENIGLSGFQYRCFENSCRLRPAFRINTRIYSCILINSFVLDANLTTRWRGKYNEDTDLSLRVLKAGLCTVLFVAFLQDKSGTMTMDGGNTNELYSGNGRERMAWSLVEQHPDIVSVTDKKYGRVQHLVDYRKFKGNKLIRKPGLPIPVGINNYGMKLCLSLEV